MSDRAAREPLLSALGQADGAALSTVLGPRAPEFAARLARLDIAQRAGMRVLHGAERTVAVFPASYADQASRITVVLTWRGDQVTELQWYAEDADSRAAAREFAAARSASAGVRGAARTLRGMRVLVTAASSGLGSEVARAFAGAGARVAIHYRADEAGARDLLGGLPADGGSHAVVSGDLAADGAAAEVVAEAARALGGPVQILVNNCGPFSLTPLAQLKPAEWHRVMDTNLTAAWLATRTAAPGMRELGYGRVINVSAGSAFVRDHAVYGLAKAAVHTLTEQLAVELGPEITVNTIAPGQIAESAAEIAAYDPTFVDRTIATTPAGRLVHRAEVAAIVLALCGSEFDIVTGAVLPVDGGCRITRYGG
jgi:NAD(P)-dependent dehydrogenase (short-subunit alcohol dehydrogenase family)